MGKRVYDNTRSKECCAGLWSLKLFVAHDYCDGLKSKILFLLMENNKLINLINMIDNHYKDATNECLRENKLYCKVRISKFKNKNVHYLTIAATVLSIVVFVASQLVSLVTTANFNSSEFQSLVSPTLIDAYIENVFNSIVGDLASVMIVMFIILSTGLFLSIVLQEIRCNLIAYYELKYSCLENIENSRKNKMKSSKNK